MSYDISEWVQSFTFKDFAHTKDSASDAADRTAVAIHDGPSGPTGVIPDAHLLFTGHFEHAGADLILRGDHGRVVVVHDYFASDHRPLLLSPEGAALSPEVVAALAGPLAPGEYAQATPTPSGAEAVGRVVKIDGDATIVRNGVAVTLHVGDAILKGDVLRTGSGTLGVTFNDGSTVNLTPNARLVVNEFVYDAHSSNNSEILHLVQGSLTFISGHVAHQGHMQINTPVATLGIRGTVGGVTEANDGTVSFYVAESATGAVLTDRQGHVLAQVLQNGPQIVVRPVGPLNVLAEEVQKTPAELAKELAVVQQMASLQSVGQQIIQQFFQPNPNNDNNPNPQSNGHPHTQILIQFPTHATADSGGAGTSGDTGGAGEHVTATVQVTTTDDTTHTTTDLLPPEIVTVTVPSDVTPPNAPTITATDDQSPVTGTIASGDSTNDATPTVNVDLSGTGALAGDTVELYNGTAAVGTPVTLTALNIAAGFVAITTPTLADGAYSLNASITDASGNTSAASNDLDFTLDTQAPAAPTVALTSDTGSSGSDHVTSDGTLTVTPAESGGTVQYSTDGGTTWGTAAPSYASDGSDDGAQAVEVRQVDAAGNEGAATTFSFTLDTLAPALAAVTGPAYADTMAADQFNAASGSLASGTADTGTTLTYGITGGGADASHSGYDTALAGTYGTLYVDSASGAYTFIPDDSAINALSTSTTEDFTVKVTDLAGNSVQQTFTVTLSGVNDAPVVQAGSASVSEEGLPNGIADTTGSVDSTNSTTATGTITATDAEHNQLTFTLDDPSASLTSGGVAVVWEGAGTSTLIGKAGGNTVITVAIDQHSGSYTVTLAAPIDHSGGGEDVKSFVVPVHVSDGSTSTSSTLTVNVEDDSPAAVDFSKTTTAAVTGAFNIAFVLDFSGSIDETELNSMLSAVKTAGQAIFNGTTGRVAITLIPFASSATTLGTFDNLTAFQSAVDGVNPSAGGTRISTTNIGSGTDFTAALQETIDHYAVVNGSQNEVFFLSDGQSTLGSTILQDWTTFVQDHGISVTAVGIGDGIVTAGLQAVDVDGSGQPLTTSGFDSLVGTLLSAVGQTQTGNILTDGSAGFGADGGHILSVAVDGVTYTWNGATTISESASHGATLSSTSFDVTTDLGGHFTFYFADGNGHSAGDWIYQGPDSNPQATTDEVFHYILTDNDGDHAGANITVSVTGSDAPPTISADSLHTSDISQSSTAVTGISFSDTDAGSNPLTFTMTADHGTLAFAQTESGLTVTSDGTNGTLTADGTLSDINQAFADGVVHTQEALYTGTNKVALTIDDQHGGTDTLNFIFDETGSSSSTPVQLDGTSGKDLIFASGHTDTMTGNGGNDTFVFKSVSDSTPGVNVATITDFTHGSDHIDLSAISGATQVQGQVSGVGTVEAHGISWYVDNTNGQTVVSVNTTDTADHVDMEIHLTGTNINLAASDILHHA